MWFTIFNLLVDLFRKLLIDYELDFWIISGLIKKDITRLWTWYLIDQWID